MFRILQPVRGLLLHVTWSLVARPYHSPGKLSTPDYPVRP